MKSSEEFANEAARFMAKDKMFRESITEAESQSRAANVAAVMFFFFVSGVLALFGKLTVGWAILLAFSCLVWRYTWAQSRMNKWSAKRLKEIEEKFPKSESP